MTNKAIRDRVRMLREEIADIREANERYFGLTQRNQEQRRIHRERQDLLKRIRDELITLSKVKDRDPSEI